MPDKKRKFETKVHRKTLNPFFNETFSFKQVIIIFINFSTLTKTLFLPPGSLQWDLRQNSCLFLFRLRSLFKTRSGEKIQTKHMHGNTFENVKGRLITKKYLSLMFENEVERKVQTLLNLPKKLSFHNLSPPYPRLILCISSQFCAKITSTDGVFFNVYLLFQLFQHVYCKPRGGLSLLKKKENFKSK